MKTNKIIITGLFAICIGLMITAFDTKDTNDNNQTTVYTIRMQNGAYYPTSLTVPLNTKVTWTNDDNTIHTVNATDGSFGSGDIPVGASYTRTFSSKGTVNYFDSYNQAMKGVLIVSDSTKRKQ
jgi:plastocyanin